MSFVKFKARLQAAKTAEVEVAEVVVEATVEPVVEVPAIVTEETPVEAEISPAEEVVEVPATLPTEEPVEAPVEALEGDVATEETLPAFEEMSKAEIEAYARDKFSLELDRRQSKNRMIEQLINKSKGE